MHDSPEGPNWPYDCRIVNNSDGQRCLQLVLQVPLEEARDCDEATPDEVRDAIEQMEADR